MNGTALIAIYGVSALSLTALLVLLLRYFCCKNRNDSDSIFSRRRKIDVSGAYAVVSTEDPILMGAFDEDEAFDEDDEMQTDNCIAMYEMGG
mmetsp:Transcript_5850/g.7820  ORF Transcript_5850/g.7820 Transcript_5850/m.7820 type:complete len:92 (-) Transcript_5850:1290-1565(-)